MNVTIHIHNYKKNKSMCCKNHEMSNLSLSKGTGIGTLGSIEDQKGFGALYPQFLGVSTATVQRRWNRNKYVESGEDHLAYILRSLLAVMLRINTTPERKPLTAATKLACKHLYHIHRHLSGDVARLRLAWQPPLQPFRIQEDQVND